MGQPFEDRVATSEDTSYPCTHGATWLTLHNDGDAYFLPMHAWGNLFEQVICANSLLLTHARMGKPMMRMIFLVLGYSYPCTHGETGSEAGEMQASLFLSMHAWGNLCLKK